MSLTAVEKEKITKGLENHWSILYELTNFSRQDLIGAVDATDAWIEANQAGYNASLPVEAQGGMTVGQKTLLFCAVALARVSPGFLKSMLPED